MARLLRVEYEGAIYHVMIAGAVIRAILGGGLAFPDQSGLADCFCGT